MSCWAIILQLLTDLRSRIDDMHVGDYFRQYGAKGRYNKLCMLVVLSAIWSSALILLQPRVF